jgi:hypothetical protein
MYLLVTENKSRRISMPSNNYILPFLPPHLPHDTNLCIFPKPKWLLKLILGQSPILVILAKQRPVINADTFNIWKLGSERLAQAAAVQTDVSAWNVERGYQASLTQTAVLGPFVESQ